MVTEKSLAGRALRSRRFHLDIADRTVILAAGDFPAFGGECERLLRSATRVVACDSAADAYFRRFGKYPDFVIGDMDSFKCRSTAPASTKFGPRIVRIADQETNDLAKAIRFCRASGFVNLLILGATGKREDHAIGNIYRALDEKIPVMTDCGEFLPIVGSLKIRTWKGNGISVFASDRRTRMTSCGLMWKLDGVKFANQYCATLNRASAESVVVTSDRPAFLYVSRNPEAVRAIVSLGSNLGNRAAFLRRALSLLDAFPQTHLVDASEVIETDGIDVPDEFRALKFLNQVAILETTLSPQEFSCRMHRVEDRLGRVRTVKNGPRTIDIDLIDFGGLRFQTRDLILPHPRAKIRPFVTTPLATLGLAL